MKQFLVLLSVLAAASAFEFKYGMRIKYSRGAGIGTKYYTPIPLTLEAALDQQMVKATRPPGAMPSLTEMYCVPEFSFCIMYDDNGLLAGTQIAVLQDVLTDSPLDHITQGYVDWVVNGVRYWALPQFFVNEEYLSIDKETRLATRDNTTVIPLDRIWTTAFHGSILEIPVKESDLEGTPWMKQSCIDGMGIHYFYNLTNQVCAADLIAPWFCMYYEGRLVASQWIGFGLYPNEVVDGGHFERTPKGFPQMIFPDAAECTNAIAEKSLSLHHYTVDNPQDIICPK